MMSKITKCDACQATKIAGSMMIQYGQPDDGWSQMVHSNGMISIDLCDACTANVLRNMGVEFPPHPMVGHLVANPQPQEFEYEACEKCHHQKVVGVECLWCIANADAQGTTLDPAPAST